MNFNLKKSFGLFLAATTAISLAGCAPATENTDSALPTIVATTNVWADVAQQVAGDNFEVIALISDPAQDPHSYEASARDQLAVSEASMFIMNGGGYDDFALTLASAAGVTAFNVYEVHEGEHAHEEGHTEDEHAHEEGHTEDEHAHEEGHTEDEHAHEEGHTEDEHAHEEGHTEDEHAHEEGHAHAHDGSDHIWYDFHVAKHMATVFATEFGKLQPENAAEFLANADAFRTAMEAIEERRDALAGGVTYFEAHPMAALLFKDLGYENVTPEGFAEAEEAGLEPSVAIVAEAEALLASGTLGFLAVNEQVTSTTLESLRETAEAASVPVLEFQELLPAGVNYQDWANSVLDQIESAR
jgi:zinc/manganese transport system substrate-binding protein